MFFLWYIFLFSSNISPIIGESNFNVSLSQDTKENITALIDRFKEVWAFDDWKNLGVFTEDYILDINFHWLKYDPPSNICFYASGVYYIFLMFIGVSGNFLVIFLFIKCKALRTSANTLIVNLAISDGLMTLKAPIFIINSFYRGPALGDIACRIYGFFGGLTGTISIITLSVISFDRYFVIKYPLNRSFSDIRVKICLLITWLYAALFAFVPALDIGFGKYTYEGYLTSCSFDYLADDPKIKNFIIIFFFAAWVVPFTLISFSYINIWKVVYTRAKSQKKGRDSFRHVKEEDKKKQEVKLALIVLSTIGVWFLSWTPYAVVALLGVTGHKNLIGPTTSMLPAMFCKTASCINAYIYALSHPKFKGEVEKICFISFGKKDKNKVWTEDSKTEITTVGEICKPDKPIPEYPGSTQTLSMNDVTSIGSRELPGTLKRQGTVVEMICLRPSFSNKPTSFRKLARRWSSKEKQKDFRELDDHVDVVSVLFCEQFGKFFVKCLYF
ncbi:opsin, ultraviolet-sensitive-like [Diabrotica virgifera virgifera]|uniref:G-protein coupled receptors family 1 profile domain-containing protein n=1 Tax=Diabrotica virgifera virgifera TaxID=50390 RepID=A0ABM5JR20_DIAVI|nr:opsin, ultraviolet-sensitive-like [Diabrotica virgifera virgifera]